MVGIDPEGGLHLGERPVVTPVLIELKREVEPSLDEPGFELDCASMIGLRLRPSPQREKGGAVLIVQPGGEPAEVARLERLAPQRRQRLAGLARLRPQP